MIISFSSVKGGVGKTVLAFNISTALAMRGHSVLYVDCSHDLDVENIFSTRNLLPEGDVYKVEYVDGRKNLGVLIAVNRDKFDYIIVDACSLYNPDIKDVVFLQSDILISPIRPALLDLVTLPTVELTCAHAKTFSPKLRAYCLITMAPNEVGVDPEVSEIQGAIDCIKQNYLELPLLQTTIGDLREFRDSLLGGRGIVEFEGGENFGADNINALLKELLNV